MFAKTAMGVLGVVLAYTLGASAASADCSVTVCHGGGCDYDGISKAIDAVNECDILVYPTRYPTGIPDPVYEEKDTVSIKGKSGLRIMAVTDGTYPACTVTLTYLEPPRPYHAFKIEDSQDIIIKGFNLTNWSREAIFLCGRLAGDCKGNKNVTIDSNCIGFNGSNENNGGIFIARTNPGTRVVNNLIAYNGRNGITLESDQSGSELDPVTIECNNILYNGWNGIGVGRMITLKPSPDPDVPGKVEVTRNIVCYNGTAPGTTGGRYGLLYEGSNSSAGSPPTNPMFNLGRNVTLSHSVFFGNRGNVSPSSSQDLGNWRQICADGGDHDNSTTTASEITCGVDLAAPGDCVAAAPPSACPPE